MVLKLLKLAKSSYLAVILYLHKNTFKIEYSPIERKVIKTKENTEFEVLELKFLKRRIPPVPSTFYFFNNSNKKSYVFFLTIDRYSFHPIEFKFKFSNVGENEIVKVLSDNYKKWKKVGYAFVFTILQDIKLELKDIREKDNNVFIEDCGFISKEKLLENCGYDKNKYVLFVAKNYNTFQIINLKKIEIYNIGFLKESIDELSKLGIDFKRDLEAHKRFSILLKDALGVSSFWEKYGNIVLLMLFSIFIMVLGTYFISQMADVANSLKVVGEGINNFANVLNYTLMQNKIINIQ
ncbi:MAG: hypothetical protein QXJ14_02700 [Candidatus Aenigmatarchaeota archaeon]